MFAVGSMISRIELLKSETNQSFLCSRKIAFQKAFETENLLIESHVVHVAIIDFGSSIANKFSVILSNFKHAIHPNEI